ncbi:MAG: tRNA preQ1(34) S-adenosylmethionine ribosyltransferase-isomerase QueA [Sphaerochaetaceae bacterium]
MKTKEFYFNLPSELIAQYPTDVRGQSRLLVLDRDSGSLRDSEMTHIAEFLEPDSLLVLNNSKVRKARVYGISSTGAKVEFLFLQEIETSLWSVTTSKSKKQKVGKSYTFLSFDGNHSYHATIVKDEEQQKHLLFDTLIDESFFEMCGHIPLPPYIKREDEVEDIQRYQTMYASHLGSVAAPTAGLHFTPAMFESLSKKNIEIVELTLHVGMGTFLPMRSEHIEEHIMHREHFELSEMAAASINKAKQERRKVVAVGTTSVRTLESCYDQRSGGVVAQSKSTDLFITPSYTFHVVDQLITNFHTPESSLLVLVSAFASKERIFDAYEHAIKEKYRFFSYGDAMFIR